MNPDTLTALVGFGGAVVGAAASGGATWLTLRHQARQAKESRLYEVGRLATDTALSELIQLHTLLDATVPPHERPTDEPWEKQARVHLRNIELALLRIPSDDLYARVKSSIQLAKDYRWAGPRHYHYLAHVRVAADDMVTSLSAYIRGDKPPAPHSSVVRAQTRIDERKAAQLQRDREDFGDADPDFAPDDAPL
ncbi:hypothetical protein ACFVZJ_21360 [Streptomyces sp. NPDC058322]|uniref:hypothetical protein n=1 Tax=Streptomyces sp. NPDC058322 TaxID=3346446 RepID=UPI0036EE1FCC